MKTCTKCGLEKEATDFYKTKLNRCGLSSWCRLCFRELSSRNRKTRREVKPFHYKCTNLKSSAKSQGVPFNLTPEYLESIWTGRCSIFDVEISLSSNDGERSLAEIDKVKPELGYVFGNVKWVCHRANRLKDNATIDELRAVIKYLEDNIES